MSKQKLLQFFSEDNAEFVLQTIEKYNYQLVFSRSRQTRLGTFHFNPKFTNCKITLNHDLDKQLMWFVFLHELAHLLVYKEFKNKLKPHGKEWKSTFRNLLIENISSFDEALQSLVIRHAKNPKANLTADKDLWYYFFPEKKNQNKKVKELAVNNLFKLNGRQFRIKEKKRTRFLCEDISTKRLYSVHGEAVYTQLLKN